MSWDSKNDYCGIATDGLVCKAQNDNGSAQYLEKPGQHGEIAATKMYGAVLAPSCEYTVEKDVTLANIELGKIVSGEDGKKFALQTVSIGTSAGGEPTVSASSVQVEDAATDGNSNHFSVPSFYLSKDEVAQILFSAFTLTGASCELTECGAEISCNVGTHLVNGYPRASDVANGKIVVTATIGQYGTAKPAVSPAEGWDVSAPLSSSDPDADYPVWTVSLTKTLEKTMRAAS